jgi:hypothetical protein
MRGVGRLATVQRWYRTVAINVCFSVVEPEPEPEP